MDIFKNANNFTNKDLRESNLRRSDHYVLLITSSGLDHYVFRAICILNNVHQDVVDMLVTSESSWSKYISG